MNQITMASLSVPSFTQILKTLSRFLDIAETNVGSQKKEPTALLNSLLFPYMYPLTSQVKFTCDFAKEATARLAGVAVPVYEDNEKTFDELQARIAKTLAFIQSIDPERINGSEDRDIALRFGGKALKLKGQIYLTGFAIPNMLFHLTAAYAILRDNGVDLGKGDFLGEVLE